MNNSWNNEFILKKAELDGLKSHEHELKIELKQLEKRAKITKKQLNKFTHARRQLEREVQSFWSKKKAEYNRHRKWAKENPGAAWSKMTSREER